MNDGFAWPIIALTVVTGRPYSVSRTDPAECRRLWVEEAARRYNRARVHFDPYQALHLAQRLKRRGITVQEFTFSQSGVGKLATTLLQLIRERSLALPDEPELVDELRNVRLKETSPGVFRLDHDRNRHDDRAVALALAASLLAERGVTSSSRTRSSFTLNPSPSRDRDAELTLVRELTARGVQVAWRE